MNLFKKTCCSCCVSSCCTRSGFIFRKTMNSNSNSCNNDNNPSRILSKFQRLLQISYLAGILVTKPKIHLPQNNSEEPKPKLKLNSFKHYLSNFFHRSATILIRLCLGSFFCFVVFKFVHHLINPASKLIVWVSLLSWVSSCILPVCVLIHLWRSDYKLNEIFIFITLLENLLWKEFRISLLNHRTRIFHRVYHILLWFFGLSAILSISLHVWSFPNFPAYVSSIWPNSESVRYCSIGFQLLIMSIVWVTSQFSEMITVVLAHGFSETFEALGHSLSERLEQHNNLVITSPSLNPTLNLNLSYETLSKLMDNYDYHEKQKDKQTTKPVCNDADDPEYNNASSTINDVDHHEFTIRNKIGIIGNVNHIKPVSFESRRPAFITNDYNDPYSIILQHLQTYELITKIIKQLDLFFQPLFAAFFLQYITIICAFSSATINNLTNMDVVELLTFIYNNLHFALRFVIIILTYGRIPAKASEFNITLTRELVRQKWNFCNNSNGTNNNINCKQSQEQVQVQSSFRNIIIEKKLNKAAAGNKISPTNEQYLAIMSHLSFNSYTTHSVYYTIWGVQNITKGTLIAFCSIIVSYLIVLIQFNN